MNETTIFTNQLSGFLRLDQILQLIPVSKATWWNGCRSAISFSPLYTGQIPDLFARLPPHTVVCPSEPLQEVIITNTRML